MPCLVVLALSFAPLLAEFFSNLWSRPQYQFFPLALAGAVFLGWTRLKDLPRPLQPSTPVTAGVLLGLSFCMLATATLLWSPWLGALAAVVGFVSVIWWRGGWRLFRCLLPTLVLTLTIIPPPVGLDADFALWLRRTAVNWSSRMLDLLNITHVLSGNIIELPKHKLLVDEACSGINSVLFTLAGCLFYMLWRRRSLLHLVLCAVSTLGFVMLGNVLRITLGAWLDFHYRIDILTGWPHAVAGLILLATYLGLMLSMDHLLSSQASAVRPMRPAPAHTAAVFRGLAALPSRRLSPYWGLAAACAFVLIGVAQLWRAWVNCQENKAVLLATTKSSLRSGATFTMPERLGDWKRLASEAPLLQKVETHGVFSQIWHYQRGATVASIALDYPFCGYHDVTICYTVNGWAVSQQKLWPADQAAGTPPVIEAVMKRDIATYASLWFSTVDERGRWLERPSYERSFLERWKVSAHVEPTTYRVQVLVTGFSPLPPMEREPVRQLFEDARKLLAQQLFEQMQRKS